MRMDMSATGTSPVTWPCGENSTTWKESWGLTARKFPTASLPWNLRTEISAQLHYVHEWGGELVVALPHLEVVDSVRVMERSAS